VSTDTNMKPKNTICLWFDKDAHEAARFYAATFPDSEVTAVHRAPGDYPGGKEGDVLTVEFTVRGIPCLGLNGGPEFRHSEAFSFQIATDCDDLGTLDAFADTSPLLAGLAAASVQGMVALVPLAELARRAGVSRKTAIATEWRAGADGLRPPQ
jgi:3-demethylubiquinone-9 3-methyltransferase